MSKDLKFTINLAKRAGNKLLREMNKISSIKKNDARDVTTNLDEETGNFIVEAIQKRFPKHNIMAEEGDNIANNSDYTWIVDPIDGTKYFVDGVKFFTVSIGLWYKGKPYLGVVYHPGTNDCFYAEKGKGAFLNNVKLKVSNVSNLNEAIISLDISKSYLLAGNKMEKFLKQLKNIVSNFFRFRALGVGSLSMCYLAQGHFDAYFDMTGNKDGQILDSGAGMAIAQEAGAKITDLNGKFPGLDARRIVVTNGKIHNELLKLLNSK